MNQSGKLFKRLVFLLPLLLVAATGVHAEKIIIEPMTTNLLANYIDNGLTFTVKLFDVNGTPVESDLYFNIYDQNGQLIYQYYRSIDVSCCIVQPNKSGGAPCVYQIPVNPQVLQQLLQTQTTGCSNNYYCYTSTPSNSFRVEAKVALVYKGGNVTTVTNSSVYNLVYVPYNLSLQMIQLPPTISKQYLLQYGLNLQSIVYVQNSETRIQKSTLMVTLYDSTGKILYQTQQDVRLTPGENLLTVPVSGGYFADVSGKVFVEEQLTVVLVNGKVLTDKKTGYFYVSDNQFGGALELMSISPDFTKMTNLEPNKFYTVQLLFNNPSQVSLTAAVQLLVYDQYGNIVVNQKSSNTIGSNQQGSVFVPFSTYGLKPGYYLLKLYIYQNDALVDQREYTVTVNADSINAVRVLRVDLNTFDVKPGSFIKLYVYLKSNLPMDVQVTPTVMSKELNLYQQLSTITLSPNYETQLPVVIYIPAGLKAGYYPVKLVFDYNGVRQEYT
ncbi:MAG: hypothetical protein ACPLX8_00050, partial [Nanopusillaceae archaeon]